MLLFVDELLSEPYCKAYSIFGMNFEISKRIRQFLSRFNAYKQFLWYSHFEDERRLTVSNLHGRVVAK